MVKVGSRKQKKGENRPRRAESAGLVIAAKFDLEVSQADHVCSRAVRASLEKLKNARLISVSNGRCDVNKVS